MDYVICDHVDEGCPAECGHSIQHNANDISFVLWCDEHLVTCKLRPDHPDVICVPVEQEKE